MLKVSGTKMSNYYYFKLKIQLEPSLLILNKYYRFHFAQLNSNVNYERRKKVISLLFNF